MNSCLCEREIFLQVNGIQMHTNTVSWVPLKSILRRIPFSIYLNDSPEVAFFCTIYLLTVDTSATGGKTAEKIFSKKIYKV